jgi:hypothetical protein
MKSESPRAAHQLPTRYRDNAHRLHADERAIWNSWQAWLRRKKIGSPTEADTLIFYDHLDARHRYLFANFSAGQPWSAALLALLKRRMYPENLLPPGAPRA